MNTIDVFGASDDLIEIEGDLREEFTLGSDDRTTLLFGDGTVLDVHYADSGVWRITQRVAGSAMFTKVEAPLDDENNYSDRVTLGGEIRWVAAAEGLTLHKIEPRP